MVNTIIKQNEYTWSAAYYDDLCNVDTVLEGFDFCVGELNVDVSCYLLSIYNKFINSSMTIGLISGEKYYDSNTSITFDVIYKLNAFSEMESFVKKDKLFVPIVKIGKVDDLQEYFSIFLKKKFPEIKKIILVENNIGSKLYRLIIKPSGVGVFVLGSHCLY